jgi:hypothetical protein
MNQNAFILSSATYDVHYKYDDLKRWIIAARQFLIASE